MKNKNIKTLIVTGLTLLNFNLAQAQSLELIWGKENKIDITTNVVKNVISSDQKSYTFLLGPEIPTSVHNKFRVLKNNFEHDNELTINIPEKFNGKNAVQQGMYKIGEKLVVFLSIIDTKTDRNKLYCLAVDEDSKISDEKLVDEIYYKGRKDKGSFIIQHLEGQKQFLITHNEGFTKKGNDEVSFKLYKEDLTAIWEKNITLPYLDKQFEILGYQTDESNNIFLFGNFFVEKDVVRKTLFTYNHQSQQLEEVVVNFSTASKVSNLNFTYENGILNFTGFYYDEKDGMRGICFTKINAKTLKTELEKLVPFSNSDILKFTSAKNVEKNKGIPKKFSIRQIITKDNGDMFIIGEAFNVEVRASKDGAYYTFNYDEIIVIRMNNNLEINWVSNIYKWQNSRDDGGLHSSYAMLSDDKNFYFVYNDNHYSGLSENGTWSYSSIQTNYNPRLVITAVTLDQKSGEFERKNLYRAPKKDNTTFIPVRSHKLNNKQLLVFAQRGSTYKVGIMTIK